MTESEIRQRLFEILHRAAPEADLDQLTPGENLRESLDIDSFDFLNVVVAIHDKFGVTVPESDYRQISTLKGMIDYLAKAQPKAV
jgi:acyl carrier protein